MPGLNRLIIQPESEGATVDESFVVGGPVGDSELLLCHGMVCVVGRIRDLILQLSKSSIYSTKPTIGARITKTILRGDVIYDIEQGFPVAPKGQFILKHQQ